MATSLDEQPYTGSTLKRGPQPELIPTRESLLSRLKNCEDQESWQEFFDTYWKLIYAVARKAGLNDAEAQDIVQETVISLVRKIGGFKYDPAVCSFKTWMLRLTRWRIINQLKKRQRDEVLQRPVKAISAEVPELPIDQIPDPVGFELEAIWDEEWRRNLLAAALEHVKNRIDPLQFQIFDLYCLENWDVRKVAQTLNVSSARVYLARYRISRLLKKEVSRLEKLSLQGFGR